jgi:hypothetical protein
MSPAWTELNTAADLVAEYAPLIKGKTILTTGVTPGSIGASFVEALAAASPALLILAGRTPSKLDAEAAAIAEKNPSVKTKTFVVDLLSLDSVRAAAAEVNGWSDVPAIDVLVNCAGIMAVPYAKSADGYESQSSGVTVEADDDLDVDFTLDAIATGSISGTVTDAESGDAIEDASVSVDGADLSAVTDVDGSYTISDVPTGEQTVTASAEGYEPASDS